MNKTCPISRSNSDFGSTGIDFSSGLARTDFLRNDQTAPAESQPAQELTYFCATYAMPGWSFATERGRLSAEDAQCYFAGWRFSSNRITSRAVGRRRRLPS